MIFIEKSIIFMIFMKINDFHQKFNDDFHRKINDFQRKINTFSSASEIVHSHDFRHLSRKMWKMLQLNGPPKVRGEWRHVLKGEVAVTQYGETAV